MEVGLSHLLADLRGARRIVSEDSREHNAHEPFLLIVRTGRVVTAAEAAVAPDTRSFQHIAEFYNYLGR